MSRYVFPGADASTPLGFYISQAESAGFEIKSIDTIGIHYSATMWRWYRNWLGNREKIEAKYGVRWFRVSFDGCAFGLSYMNTDSGPRFGSTFWRRGRLPRGRVRRLVIRLLW